jgi:hypothetical protein
MKGKEMRNPFFPPAQGKNNIGVLCLNMTSVKNVISVLLFSTVHFRERSMKKSAHPAAILHTASQNNPHVLSSHLIYLNKLINHY